MILVPDPGDWIRFYRDDILVIGIVQYVVPTDQPYSGGFEIMTDIGKLNTIAIFEIRRHTTQIKI